ncbi:GNAT family N-acetyltransferase, partial [Streptomyces cellulosae]
MGGVEIRDDRGAGRLEAVEGGEVVGRIEYFVLEEPAPALVPVHTVVEPAHEGKGIAGALARELYGLAAREGVAVAPLCPVAEAGVLLIGLRLLVGGPLARVLDRQRGGDD